MIATLRKLISGDFARHGALVFLTTMTINVLGYAFHFAISRKVGVEQYGELAALNAGYMISLVFAQISSTVVVKYAAEFRVLGDASHLAGLSRRLCLYGSAIGVVGALLGLAVAAPIAGYLKISNVTAVSLALVVMALSFITPTLRSVFIGIEDFRIYSISSIMESGLKAVLGIGLVYAGYGVTGAFGGWALGVLLTVAYTMTVLLARYRKTPPTEVSIDFRRLAVTMAGVSACSILLTSLGYADVIIVKHYADPTTAGLYGALSLSGKILLFVVGFVPTVLLPKASRQAHSGTSPVRILIVAVAVVLGISGVGLVGYYFLPGFIVTTLAGQSFAPAAPYVFFYGVAMVLLAALSTVATYKIGIHRFDFVLPLAVCAVAELVGISVYHRSLTEIIAVLIAGNSVALVASVYRINAPLRSIARTQRSDAAA